MVTNLLLTVLTLFCVLYPIEAITTTFDNVKDKFRAGKIEPDVVDNLSNMKLLKVSYPTGVTASLGNTLTPTLVKDQPKVEWEADKSALYTLLMTGETL